MEMADIQQHVIAVFALVAALGVAAQWVSWRIGLPAIVLLTVSGVLVGPVAGWVRPSEDLGVLFEPIIKVGVAVILFEGGLSLQFHELRHAAKGVSRLVTFAVAISFALGSAAARYVEGLDWPVSLVFGAIMVVTGPTVIIPLLRHARLRRRTASYLKWEGIINDPVGAVLAVAIFEYFVFAGEGAFASTAARVFYGLLSAAALGAGTGLAMGVVFRRGYIPEYLKGPAALAAAVGVYVLANRVLAESGLLASTLLGIVVGNMRLPSIEELRRFKQYVALILVSWVFILITAEFRPETLLGLDLKSQPWSHRWSLWSARRAYGSPRWARA